MNFLGLSSPVIFVISVFILIVLGPKRVEKGWLLFKRLLKFLLSIDGDISKDKLNFESQLDYKSDVTEVKEEIEVKSEEPELIEAKEELEVKEEIEVKSEEPELIEAKEELEVKEEIEVKSEEPDLIEVKEEEVKANLKREKTETKQKSRRNINKNK